MTETRTQKQADAEKLDAAVRDLTDMMEAFADNYGDEVIRDLSRTLYGRRVDIRKHMHFGDRVMKHS